MAQDVIITPASGKIEFLDSSDNVDARINLSVDGNLEITSPGGDISLGDTTADLFIGDGTNNVDIIFEQDGEIRALTNKTLTIGSDSSNVDIKGASITFTGADSGVFSGNVTATTFIGALTGNASTATTATSATTATTATNVTASANNSTNETVYLTFVDGATGSQGIETDTGLTYNPSTGLITSTAFSGNGSSLTNLNASSLASGTIPDARFPAALPAIDGSALTGISSGGSGSGISGGVFLEYEKTVDSDYTIDSDGNGRGIFVLSAADDSSGLTIATGATVTVNSGSSWVLTGGDKNMGLDAMVGTSNQTERTMRTGTIKPTLDSSYDLGDSAVGYRHIYGGNITLSNGGTKYGEITVDGGDLAVDGPAGHTGLRMTTSGLLPRQNGAIIDNTIDLGSGSYRYNDLYLGGGLYVGGTGSVNHLDDYEEGTFTPAYTSGVSGTYQTQFGTYTKVGRLVYVEIHIDGNSMTGDANQLKIGGLPFTSQNVASNGGLYHVYTGGTYDGGNTTTWLINENEAVVYAYNINGATWKGNEMSDLNGGYRIAGFYQTAT